MEFLNKKEEQGLHILFKLREEIYVGVITAKG